MNGGAGDVYGHDSVQENELFEGELCFEIGLGIGNDQDEQGEEQVDEDLLKDRRMKEQNEIIYMSDDMFGDYYWVVVRKGMQEEYRLRCFGCRYFY